MQADFNPGFSFNIGQGNDDYQAPWEFKGDYGFHYPLSLHLYSKNKKIKTHACQFKHLRRSIRAIQCI